MTDKTRWSLLRSNLLPLLRLLWRTDRILITLLFILYFLQSLIPVSTTYLAKVAIDVLVQISGGNQGAVRTGFMLLLASAGLMLMNIIIGMSMSTSERYVTAYFSQEVETLIIEKSQRLPLAFFDQPQSYDRLQRARNGFGERAVGTMTTILRIGSSVITLASYLILLSVASPWLPLVLVPVTAISLYRNVKWGQQRYELFRSQTTIQRITAYLSNLMTGAEAAKERKLFGLGPYLKERWIQSYSQVRNQSLSLSNRQTLQAVGNSVFNFTMSLMVMIWLFVKLVHSQITLGTYTAMSGAVFATIGLMPQIAAMISQIYEGALYIGDLFDFLSLPEEVQQGLAPFPASLEHGITVEDLEFCYPGAEHPTLRGISFEIKPGERVAIVGENGSGKSTLVKCLLGLYEPVKGTIYYDGVNIRNLDPGQFRKRVTAVFQDFMRYALTVRENVAFGNLDALHDEAALQLAVAKSGTESLIGELPEGWDTPLSRMWERGQELSYGQWQRLAVARGLVGRAAVIMLDEPAAALDPKAEAALVEQFMRLTSECTSLIVSHRFGTARVADRILVMKAGALVEEGSHEELMKHNGEYARMFRLQARWYL